MCCGYIQIAALVMHAALQLTPQLSLLSGNPEDEKKNQGHRQVEGNLVVVRNPWRVSD